MKTSKNTLVIAGIVSIAIALLVVGALIFANISGKKSNKEDDATVGYVDSDTTNDEDKKDDADDEATTEELKAEADDETDTDADEDTTELAELNNLLVTATKKPVKKPAKKPAANTSAPVVDNKFKLTPDYKLVWADEFNSSTLNTSDWNYETHEPGWVNSELQSYEASTDNVYLQDGKLVIQPIKKVGADGKVSYTSGRINTQNKQNFKYGYFECRAKVPTGAGYLPAFWMMPADENLYGQWPRCGEIDIMEVMGQQTNKLYGTIHFGNPHSESQGTRVLSSGNFADEYHTFSCEWEPGSIKWYCDGILFHEENDWYSTTEGVGTVSYPAPFDQPFYIIFNVAVGGSWVGNINNTTKFDSSSQLVVDYVRVYQKANYDENVEKPVKEVVLRDPDKNGNYINNGTFANEDLTDDVNWKFMTANGGVATASIANNTMTIKTTKDGDNDYSVQLVQAGIPLKKGASYRVIFDAKASAERSMNVAVKAPDRGYSAYMSENVDLTTSYKTYSIDFKMKEDSDANGRLEYNMGATGSTATIDIKNVKIIMTEDATEASLNQKEILGDGNLVYNGEFQEGTGRLAYWDVSDKNAVYVTNENNVRELCVKVNGAAIPVTVSQKDLAFTDGMNYELSFKARGNASLIVSVAGDLHKIDLTDSNKTYTFPVSKDTYTNKDIAFKVTGTGTVYVDSVRIVEDALIKNGSFNAGTSGFEFYVHDSANASYVVDSQKEDNALDITIKKTGSADYMVQVKQQPVKLEEGKYYRLSFDIRSSMDRSFTYAIQRDGLVHKDAKGNEDWTPYVQDKVKLTASTTAYTTVSKEFQMTEGTDTAAVFNIALGGGELTTQHRVCIDNVKLVEIEALAPEPEVGPQEGEMIKNGDFSKGAEDWSAEVNTKDGLTTQASAKWDLTKGNATVDIATLGSSPADASLSWLVNIKQNGITLVKGCEYELTAKLVSNADRTIQFSCMDSKSQKWYVTSDNNVSLKAGVPKTVKFTISVGNNDTDKSAYVGFNMGRVNAADDASIITLDDVSMVCVSGTPTVDPEEPEDEGDEPVVVDTPVISARDLSAGNKLENGDFTKVSEGAGFYLNGTTAELSVVDGKKNGLISIIAKEPTNSWDTQIFEKIPGGIEAGKTYKYSIDIVSTNDRDVNFAIQKNHDGYGSYTDKSVSLKANIVKTIEGTYTATATDDNVTFRINLAKSGSVAGHKIVVANAEFYEVAGEPEGPVAPQDVEGNMIDQAMFTVNALGVPNGWWLNGATSTVDDQKVLTVSPTGTEPNGTEDGIWSVMLGQNYEMNNNLKVVAGHTYKLSATVKTSDNRDVKVELQTMAGTVIGTKTESLSAGVEKEITTTFTPDADNNAAIQIHMCNAGATGQTIKISKLYLIDVTAPAPTDVEGNMIDQAMFTVNASGVPNGWWLNGATSTVDDQKVLTVSPTGTEPNGATDGIWSVMLGQNYEMNNNLKVEAGHTYKLSATVEASDNRDVKVELQTMEGAVIGTKTESLSAGTAKEITTTFTVDTDNNASIQMHMCKGGATGQTIKISKLYLIDVTAPALTDVEGNMIDQAMFTVNASGVPNGWWLNGATSTVDDQKVLTVSPTGTEPNGATDGIWSVMLGQNYEMNNNLKVVTGHTYKLSATVKTSDNRDVKVELQTMAGTVIGTKTESLSAGVEKEITTTFTPDADNNAAIQIHMCNAGATGQTIKISKVYLVDITTPGLLGAAPDMNGAAPELGAEDPLALKVAAAAEESVEAPVVEASAEEVAPAPANDETKPTAEDNADDESKDDASKDDAAEIKKDDVALAPKDENIEE